MVDLEQIIRAAVESALAADRDRRREDVRAAVVEALEGRDADQIGGIQELSAWLGQSVAATKSTVHRRAELAALSFRVGSRRRWRRSEVLAWLADERKAPRLRAVGGGK